MDLTPSDPAVWQTLSQCIDDENDDAVMALINAGDLGINETSEEGSALIYAANFGRNDLIRRLLAAGADVNMPMSEVGVTALHAAVSQDRGQTARLLVDSGADVEARAGMAVRSKFFYSPHCAEAALHLAAAYADERVLRMLLEAGANSRIEDGIGAQPIDYLRRHRNPHGDVRKLKEILQ